MKILCICDHGQCRSVAMANVLRERGHDAIAISEAMYFRDKKSESVFILNNWAEKFLHMEEAHIVNVESNVVRYSKGAKEYFGHVDAWIGRDEWGSADNAELLELCRKKATELGL